MERYDVQVELRQKTGKGAARSLRRKGKIPAVVYGKTIDPQPLTVDLEGIQNKLNSNAIFNLKIIDKDENQREEIAMVKDYQKDVIKGKIIHVDFQKISMDEKISIEVPIKLIGDAKGVQEGGVLQQLMREVAIEVLPENIPDELELDISELDVGDSLQVGDLDVGEDIDLVDSPEEVIVTVVTPSEEIEEEEEIEDEFIEPEVIGEEDEEEEGEIEEETEEEEPENK